MGTRVTRKIVEIGRQSGPSLSDIRPFRVNSASKRSLQLILTSTAAVVLKMVNGILEHQFKNVKIPVLKVSHQFLFVTKAPKDNFVFLGVKGR